MQDTSRISDFALLLAMLINDLLMENVFVDKDTTSLDTVVVFAHQLKSMTQHTEFVMLNVKIMKFGILSSDHADVFQDITLLMEFALNVIPRLKSTTTESNAATVNKVTEKHQVKVVKANVFLSVQSTKTSS